MEMKVCVEIPVIIGLMAERQFGKIELLGRGKLKIIVDGTVSNITESAAPRINEIHPDLLLNLKSLAIRAQGEFGDSSDENAYNLEIKKLKERFPKEQPEDVWSRTLATLMADGVTIDSISRELLGVSEQYRLSKNIGGITPQVEENELQKIRDTITEYWPKRK